MGKLPLNEYNSQHTHAPHCKDRDTPICGNESCQRSSLTDTKPHAPPWTNDGTHTYKDAPPHANRVVVDEPPPIQELIIVGAGAHALTLLLRLLEPDPDFRSEGARHSHDSAKQMRPFRDVYRHVNDLARGPSATLKVRKTKKGKKKSGGGGDGGRSSETRIPPPLSLATVLDSVRIIDAHGKWLTSWNQNFEAIGIPRLRSLMNAHADPFDHRSLEYYAEVHGRGDELVTLTDLKRDQSFRGPYQVPTTRLFHDFHEELVRSYGIADVVRKGKVLSIDPVEDRASGENVFEVRVCDGTEEVCVRARRCVCALGPRFGTRRHPWEEELRNDQGAEYHRVSKRILRSDEIVRWLLHNKTERRTCRGGGGKRVLVVGGGITSVQLVLRALNASFFESVVFIQKSRTLQRHFDVENAWMGPKRGALLDDFYSKDMKERSKLLRQARRGGSIPPELWNELRTLETKTPHLICKEEVELSHAEWTNDEFNIVLSDGSTTAVDTIWLATGCENAIDGHPALDGMRRTLPIDVVDGLPALAEDLSWAKAADGECGWKRLARGRMWCMGALAGLQLGADALNIVGARHGAVKIADAIRRDMDVSG